MVGSLGVLELGGDLLDNSLAVLKVLDEDIDLTSELSLGILGRLQLLFQVVEGVGQAVNFHGHLLLESISFLNTETVFILVLLLPVSIFLLPLGNLKIYKTYILEMSLKYKNDTYGSLKCDLKLTEFFNLDSESLNGALKGLDLGVSSVDTKIFRFR